MSSSFSLCIFQHTVKKPLVPFVSLPFWPIMNQCEASLIVGTLLLFQILVWKELDYGKMTEVEKQMLVSEVNLLRELKHPHIVRYYDRIIDRSNTTIYIVMEFCEGGV